MRDEMMAMAGMALGSPPSAVTSLSLCYLTVRWRRSLSKFPLVPGNWLLWREDNVASGKSTEQGVSEPFELLQCLCASVSLPIRGE